MDTQVLQQRVAHLEAALECKDKALAQADGARFSVHEKMYQMKAMAAEQQQAVTTSQQQLLQAQQAAAIGQSLIEVLRERVAELEAVPTNSAAAEAAQLTELAMKTEELRQLEDRMALQASQASRAAADDQQSRDILGGELDRLRDRGRQQEGLLAAKQHEAAQQVQAAGEMRVRIDQLQQRALRADQQLVLTAV